MSETEKTKITTPFMSETEIAAKSVRALSNRPNEHSGQYGRKGLTPEELKAAFSALPEAIAAKMNELLPQILARFDETENAFNDADEALRAAITEAIAAAGKTVTVSEDGLVVIASAPIEDKGVLTTLYRALM